MSERITQGEYNAQILSIIDSARADFGAQTDEDLAEAIDQIIESHEWVIYTWQARQVRSLTDSPNAYWDEFQGGETLAGAPGSDEILAFWSIREDVQNALEWYTPEEADKRKVNG